MQLQEINQLDLFSGIGGFHLGFERAGYKVNSYFSEVDKHAVAVYKNQFKDSTYVGSVTDVRGEDLPRIDLITFGSPCQDFSLAGKRKGMGGERSSLITEAIRLVHECRPRVFIWENVKGTFSSNDGADFWAIIQAFANIGGYRCEWQLCNTSWFLPQNRERIYLVGYLAETRGDWRGVFPIGETAKHIDEKVGNEARETTSEQTAIARTISSRIHKMGNDDTYIKVKSATSTGYEVATQGDSINLSQPNSETRRGRVGKGKAQTLETSCNQAVVEPKIIGYTRDAKGKVTDRHLKDEAGTIHSSSGGGGNTDQFVQDYRIRRLTPIECERLQGFPDNHTEYGNYDGEVKKMSNTQRYKQCGNAVTVDVVQAIANKLHPLFE
jgi:DNA (cytosine-5)-methyltransferase 1